MLSPAVTNSDIIEMSRGLSFDLAKESIKNPQNETRRRSETSINNERELGGVFRRAVVCFLLLISVVLGDVWPERSSILAPSRPLYLLNIGPCSPAGEDRRARLHFHQRDAAFASEEALGRVKQEGGKRRYWF